ncbi:MAG: hypothetical protein KJ047_09990 [Anaerolineae bacterium]|nr:hypothetical protein [Anaerolineae bacterium]MEB2289130.1 hypothetical protein [Anaerolineae bacterium]
MFEGCSGCCLSVILIPLLCLGLIACVVIYAATSDSGTPVSSAFKPSLTESLAFERAIDDAIAQARSQGWWALKFTERELSSWMALEGKAFAEEHGHVYPFTNVRVKLDDGEMRFYADVEVRFLKVPLKVFIKPGVDVAGQIAFDVTKVDVAGIGVPDFAVQTVKAQFEDVLIRPFADLPGSYFLYQQSLLVDNGTFEVQGIIR